MDHGHSLMLLAVDIETADQQLRRERAAVNKLRDILFTYPAVRKELREASPHFLGFSCLNSTSASFWCSTL